MRRLNGIPAHTPRMLLQWHVTERCNLRCSHCYQESLACDELDAKDHLWIIDQFEDLLAVLSRNLGRRVFGHITLTGGEPFLRDDFMNLLDTIAAASAWTRFSLLSNGTLIDARLARRLAKLKPAYVQVSMEGGESTHDRIRGPGSFKRTVAGIKHLRRAGIPTVISFTAHRDNFREFETVARLGCRFGVAKVWADRLVPMGRGAGATMLSKDETRTFFRFMQRARNHAKRRWFTPTRVVMHRALQFLEGGGHPYHCTAGRTLLTLLPNGDLTPCRRMPIITGNVMETSLSNLYMNSPVLQSLRDDGNLPAECGTCAFKKECRGGLKCLSHAVTGNPHTRDPGCYMDEQTVIQSASGTEK